MPPPLPGSPVWQRVGSHAPVLDYHLSMLQDAHRMDAFRRAIDASVQPGDVVVDLGCGTGVLSFMACEAGAAKVYAIEGGPVIDAARELAADNGFADRIEFLEGWSLEVGIPEPADVLISETLGNAGLDEGIVAWTADARERLLRPGAVLLPQRVRVWVAAAESLGEDAVAILDVSDLLCGEEKCEPVIGGLITNFDQGHFASAFARTLSPEVSQALEATIASGR